MTRKTTATKSASGQPTKNRPITTSARTTTPTCRRCRSFNERYRRLAFQYYLRQKADSRVPNGWTVIDDVTTTPATHGDLTSGYWYSEQMKYWYLMFSGTDRFDYRNNYLSTEGNVFRGVRRPH